MKERGSINYKTPTLSVIIPMYNCAPVIKRCLESIDYSDCEVLVVNDGSTDEGADVVSQYLAKHSNVRLINKENGGVSSARNKGIEEAIGKYITFIDADDFWFPHGISRIIDLAEQHNADIVKYHIHHIENEQSIPSLLLENYTIYAEHIEGRGNALTRRDISDYHVVDALFKRSVIMDNNIRFRTDLHLHEDDCFMGMYYCHASKVISTDLPLYCYIHSSNYSSTHHQSIERQRILINSGYLAAQYRSSYVQAHYPQAMPMERLKYMRWVCQPKEAIAAHLLLTEYQAVLDEFHALGVWPLQYKYINVSYWWAPIKYKMKCALNVWLTNHPRIAYTIFRGKM